MTSRQPESRDAGLPPSTPQKKSLKVDDKMATSIYDQWQELVVHQTAPPAPTFPACYVIFSTSSMSWTLLSLLATGLVGFSIVTSHWLVAPRPTAPVTSVRPVVVYASAAAEFPAKTTNISVSGLRRRTTTALGLLNECSTVLAVESGASGNGKLFADWNWNAGIERAGLDGTPDCRTYVTGLDMPDAVLPNVWKSALLLLTGAAALLIFSSLTAILSVCVQAIFTKSIFTVSGLIQSIAALLLVVGQLLFVVGWSSQRVRDMCGSNAGPFTPDQCSIGLSFYACMCGTGLAVVCALLSMRAETDTSTDQVEKLILDGRLVVCVR